MRLDHLLSKGMSKGWNAVWVLRKLNMNLHKFGRHCEAMSGKQLCVLQLRSERSEETYSGGDALRGHTRSHPEHDG